MIYDLWSMIYDLRSMIYDCNKKKWYIIVGVLTVVVVAGWRWPVVCTAHLEDYLHVVCGAPSADAPVEVVLWRRADKVVVVPGEKLQPAGLRCKRPERYGEVHCFCGFVANRYHPRTRVRYSAGLVFFFRHLKGTQINYLCFMLYRILFLVRLCIFLLAIKLFQVIFFKL